MERSDESRSETRDEYTAESLRMLETAEGQKNAVFACFGSAVQHAQLFEQGLERFIGAYNTITSESLRTDDIGRKMTMGQLLHRVRQYVTTNSDSIEKDFTAALEQRNYLIHRFFLERAREVSSGEGRLRLLSELLRMQARFERCRVAIDAMRIAMCDALGVEDQWASEYSN